MARRAIWIDNRISLGVTSGGQQNQSLLQGTPPIDMRGTTVVRSVLDLYLSSTTTAGAWGVSLLDIAIGLTSQEAFNAGVLPDPNADERPVRGWMFRTQCAVAQNGVGAQILYECHRDLRTGRKVDDGEVFMVVDNTALRGATFSVDVTGMVRLLVLLP